MAEWARYFETDAEDGSEVKVSLGYDLGGINYWNYEVDPRGYYVYVTVVKREKWEYGTSESFMLGDGFKRLVKEVKRRSAKATAEAVAMAEEMAQELAERLAEQKGLTLTGVTV